MESLCARFLWSGSVDRFWGAKVAWSELCYPKAEGGLGLRKIGSWNSNLCLKLVWLLFSSSGSLWVAWHHHQHIKGTSFWSLKASVSDSWNWKSLLQLRPLAEQFVTCKVRNGQRASFWFDKWTPLGPLLKYVGDDGPRLLGIPIQSSVSAALDNYSRRAHRHRSGQILALHGHLSTIHMSAHLSDGDSYSWEIQGSEFEKFPTAKTWDYLRPRNQVKVWSDSVWFKGATPKHSFIMWMAQLDRLPTRSRLAAWGMQIPSTCCLCSDFEETRDHLLLRCAFSEHVWNLIQTRLHLSPCIFYTWPSLLAWTKLKTASSPQILRKLVAQAAIYHIWKQRNNFLYNQISVPPYTVFKTIEKEIRNTITARRNRKFFRNLMALWIR